MSLHVRYKFVEVGGQWSRSQFVRVWQWAWSPHLSAEAFHTRGPQGAHVTFVPRIGKLSSPESTTGPRYPSRSGQDKDKRGLWGRDWVNLRLFLVLHCGGREWPSKFNMQTRKSICKTQNSKFKLESRFVKLEIQTCRTRFRRNDDLLWRGPTVKKKPPFYNTCALITCEIMRSGDAQCNTGE